MFQNELKIDANPIPEEDIENDPERISKWCPNGNQHLRANITFDKTTRPKMLSKLGAPKCYNKSAKGSKRK